MEELTLDYIKNLLNSPKPSNSPLENFDCETEAEHLFSLMEKADYKSYLSFLRQFKEMVDCLSEEDKQVLMTFLGGSLEISDTAKALGIAERTVYYRRNRLAERLSARLEGEYRK